MIRLYCPRDSLILLCDVVSQEDAEETLSQIDYASRYYPIVPLKELTQLVVRKKSKGKMSIGLKSPRVGLRQFFLPPWKERSFPATLFVDPSLVGTNRLSLDDRISGYERHNARKLSEIFLGVEKRRLFESREARLSFEERIRREFPVFPIDVFSPFEFSMTWGKLKEMVEDLKGTMDIGWSISQMPQSGEDIETELRIFDSHLATRPELAFSLFPVENRDLLRNNGLTGLLVSSREGAIKNGNDPFCLPHWKMTEGRV